MSGPGGTVPASPRAANSGRHAVVPQGTPVFDVRGLSKAFGPRALLDAADLQVWPGETLAIIGESGSGKSVFLKLLAGLLEPDAGSVWFKGQNIAEFDRAGVNRMHREIGYVFQSDAMFDSMTVLDNVGYALREHTNQSDEEIRARATECITRVDL